ncbi:PIN domain-like protein [Neocallimastix lanati (nom. inval.)]|jgi:flap endonuclease-1|uniref:Flap endonuclease 1 n=1 Tax=Neocallimastix californiae TaxID=1754190 RepID=A0A1Y2DCU8_9FUNG|nr:PIN domain-like protein [Neocallimastix sp. JGI-2020a]ORY57017.1 PIN domain-like protein [Neocallimastix californiae]|eukprot:ORY57017.1 PIN domain-like protein [Neocallimastix californiae]
MGIKNLSKVIGDHSPDSTKDNDIKTYFGRKVAIDASMSIYQFLIAVRQTDGMQLTNDNGEITSHLMGIFYRTIRMCENGIKPLYVFDGKPPTMKSGELSKRLERREEAQKNMEKAAEEGNAEEVEKFSRRTVKVTKEHNAECQRLLKAMGIPYICAPCEAEAQCAELCKSNIVYGACSEDMDTLTFGSPVLLRHMTFSEARKMPISEIHYDKVLEGLEMDRSQFIDLCILLGCDYCESIGGIGPKRAVALIQQYKNIETILKNIDTKKYTVPENWQYKEARELFINPEVDKYSPSDVKWEKPNEEEIVKFLVHEKGFNEDRVRKAAQKLTKLSGVATQGRLDSFFKTIPSNKPATKRKTNEKPQPKAKKAKKGGFKPRR